MPPSLVAIVNERAGPPLAEPAGERVAAALARHGVAGRVVVVPGGQVARAAREAVEDGARIVLAAGGDGTASAVASQVAGSDAALGVLPLGTLNHFARDAGVPLDLDEAVAAIAEGEEARVDVGRVAGTVFLNNATLGLYPDQVRTRERWRRWLGKWPAAALASLVVLRRFSSMRLGIEADGEEAPTRTPLVVVSNNAYALEAGRPHRRTCLDGGTLGLYVVRAAGRWRFVKTALRSLTVSLEGDDLLDAREARRVAIESRRRRVSVAVDGEVLRLRPPIVCETAPGGLRLVGAGACAATGAA
jgi:diacylglycerol kinase family enzyme